METTRGIPTAWAAAPMSKVFTHSKDDVPVWPDPDGTVKGQALASRLDDLRRLKAGMPKLLLHVSYLRSPLT